MLWLNTHRIPMSARIFCFCFSLDVRITMPQGILPFSLSRFFPFAAVATVLIVLLHNSRNGNAYRVLIFQLLRLLLFVGVSIFLWPRVVVSRERVGLFDCKRINCVNFVGVLESDVMFDVRILVFVDDNQISRRVVVDTPLSSSVIPHSFIKVSVIRR